MPCRVEHHPFGGETVRRPAGRLDLRQQMNALLALEARDRASHRQRLDSGRQQREHAAASTRGERFAPLGHRVGVGHRVRVEIARDRQQVVLGEHPVFHGHAHAEIRIFPHQDIDR